MLHICKGWWGCTVLGKLSEREEGKGWEIDQFKIPKHATDLYYSLLRILTITILKKKPKTLVMKRPKNIGHSIIQSSLESKWLTINQL